ncbi:Skp1 family, dimerization domain-containing protein [Cyathus striatus]|nr:Skp1 family, dimerization domain-containing protein [Cyathus striatus]
MVEVIFKCSDNERITVEEEVIAHSTNVRKALQGVGEGVESFQYDLPDVTSSTLKKVLEYCEYHRYDPLPEENNSNSEDLKTVAKPSEWDRSFFRELNRDMLFQVILAAHTPALAIRPLVARACRMIAEVIRNMKTPQEIRDYLGIENDLTPEEEEQIRLENEWISDPPNPRRLK